MTGGVSAAAVSAVTDPDPAGFDHVLAGMALVGPAARLAAMLEVEFLAEAGWDPAARVLSLPAAHPLLGRRLCRVGGCLSTTRGTTTGGVCGRCITRLTGEGMTEQQIASADVPHFSMSIWPPTLGFRCRCLLGCLGARGPVVVAG